MSEENLIRRGKIQISQYIDTIIVILLGAAILLSSPYLINHSGETGNRYASPVLFPKVLAYTLIILGVMHLILKVKKNISNSENQQMGSEEKGEKKSFLIGLCALCVYVILIPIAGFVVATLLSSFYFVYYFGKPKWYQALLFTIISTTVIYYIFGQLLNVPLPNPFFL